MQFAYQQADRVIQVTPHMPMSWLDHRIEVGPVSRLGKPIRDEINRLFGLDPDERLIMVNMGGIDNVSPMAKWPRIDRTRWLVIDEWMIDRDDFCPLSGLPGNFTDILCSCDALIGKPGYGLVVEAACNGIPMLYVARGNWPEEPYLLQWMHRNNRALEISRQQFTDGMIEQALETVLKMAPVPRPEASGAAEAADLILAEFGIIT